jgi:hypothetical protein
MQATKALLIKFLVIAAISVVILSFFYNVDIASVLLVSAAITIISYIAGDRLVLPRTNNMMATLADFGLSFLLLILFLNTLIENPNFPIITSSLLTAAGIAVGEYFIHRMLITNNNSNNYDRIEKSPKQLREAYSTELSEELMKNEGKK